jgi:hypothetical protein
MSAIEKYDRARRICLVVLKNECTVAHDQKSESLEILDLLKQTRPFDYENH